MPGKHYRMGGAIKRRAEQMRSNPANPVSRREKEKDGANKTKTGGILGQNKQKQRVARVFRTDDEGVKKTKRRFGRTVETTRTASGKEKTVTKKDGTVTKGKTRGDARELSKKVRSMEKGGKVKAVKSYKKGGKVVAQGADRADKRADRKAARLEKRKDRKA